MIDRIDTAQERVADILNDWEYQARERDARDPIREQILEEAAIIRHALDAERTRAEKAEAETKTTGMVLEKAYIWLRDAEAERDQALARLAMAYEVAAQDVEEWREEDGETAYDAIAGSIRALTPADAEAALQRVVDAAWNEAVEAAAKIVNGTAKYHMSDPDDIEAVHLTATEICASSARRPAMSDDLRKLIEAVEVGTWTHDPHADESGEFSKKVLGRYSAFNTAWDAYHGSVDAAIALCKALLPGWGWEINSAGQVARVFRNGLMDDTSIWADNPILSRALLLAVLRAKLMEASHE